VNAQALIDRLVVNPGLPEGLANQLLRGALDELCTQSGVWKVRRGFTVPDGHEDGQGAVIELPKTADGTRRVGIFGLTWRGNRPWGNSLVPDVHRGVLVDRAGCVKAGDELAWTDVLTPEEDWSEVPEEVLGALAPAAEWLARARALEMHGRPWSNPNLALAARREYSREVSGLLRREITGNSFGPLVAAAPEAFFDE
jgi:hypothetical protein